MSSRKIQPNAPSRTTTMNGQAPVLIVRRGWRLIPQPLYARPGVGVVIGVLPNGDQIIQLTGEVLATQILGWVEIPDAES